MDEGDGRMEGITRRECIAMGAVPVLSGAATYAAREGGLWPGDGPPRFDPAAGGSPRARLQRQHLPNVPLVTHEGRRVRFYSDLVKDKKVVFTFLSSRGPAESRKVMQNLAAAQRFFGWRVGSDIYMYSIARNPERDSAAVLARWARRSGAGPGWRFLTGEPSAVEMLRHSLGFASPDRAEDADPAYSIGLLRYGIEPEMNWAQCQSQAEPRVILHSMLLDFGTGEVGPAAPPVWNCRLLLRQVR
jgi:protein SCO1/2